MRTIFVLLALFSIMTLRGQVHVVSNLADSGPGSLRAQISQASEGDTVVISATLLANGSASIQLQSEILITTPMTIIGAIQSGDTIFISGNNATRAFNIDFSTWLKTIRLVDLAIVDCYTSTLGGAIITDNVYKLEVESCLFRNNRTNFGLGGAICMDGGEISCLRSNFVNNKSGASCGSSSSQTGGAIDVLFGKYSIDSCLFINNETCARGGALNASSSYGTISNSEFHSNSTLGGSLGGGGALYLNGGSSTIQNCVFNNNSSDDAGGAIEFTSSYTTVNVTGCTFSNNYANFGAGAGIRAFGVDQLNVTRCTFTNNTLNPSSIFKGSAVSHSEGSSDIRISTFHNNPAPALHISSPNTWNFVLENSTIANSSSTSAELIYVGSNHTSTFYSNILVAPGTGSSISTGGTVSASGYNIFRDSPAFKSTSDQANIAYSALQFQSLDFYGGTTKTLLPGKLSPADEMGSPTDFSAAQNGPVYGRREVGAAERAVVISDTIESCGPYTTWGNNFNTSGTYYVNFQGTLSLDSTGILVLSITSIDTLVSDSAAYLVSNESYADAKFHWLDCTKGFAMIPGDTNRIFQPSANGSYAVVITKGQCNDTSSCKIYDQVSLPDEDIFDPSVLVYPNPSEGVIHMYSDTPLKPIIDIFSLQGSHIASFEMISGRIELSGLASGTYLIRFTNYDHSEFWKKLIIK